MDISSPNFSPDFSPIKMDPRNPLHHTSFNHSEHPINLLNFDPSWRRPDFLDSPRSIEACLLLGIEQRELLQKNMGDLKDEYIPPQFLKHSDEYLDLKLHYSEHIRLQKLGKCIQAREKLIEEGQKKEMSYYNPFFDSPKKTKKRSKSPEQASVIAWNLDDELKKVEELKKKQEGRIESFINSENERIEKRENMYNKLLRIKELEDERVADYNRRREEAKNRSLSRDKLRSDFSPEGKKARHEMLEKEFSKIMTQFGEDENKKGKKKRRNRAERMKQKTNDTTQTEESVIYTQNKLEFVSQVLTKRRQLADKAYGDEIKRKVMAQSSERLRRNKSENRFYTEKSREESPSFFDRWAQDELNRSQSRLERDIEKLLRPARKEEHERQVRQRREDQEDMRELVGRLILDQRDHDISRAEEQKEKIKEINLKKFMYEYLKNEEALQSIPRDERARTYKGKKLEEKMKNKRDNKERIRIEKQAVLEHKKALESEYNKERSSIKLSFMKEKEKLDYELRERLKSSPKTKSKLKRCKSSTGYKNPKNFYISSGHESRATAYDSRTLRTDTQDRTHRGGFNMMSIDSHSEMEGERSFERDVYEDIIGENDEIVRQKSSKKGHMASRLNIIYEKGQSHIKVPKLLKSSSREMRPMLKSQPSERSFRSNQAEAEWVHAEVAKVKKDQVRSLLGLLELEIENNEDSNHQDLEGSAQKILRFIKGQEQEIWKMMRNVNYLDLNPLDKFTESQY